MLLGPRNSLSSTNLAWKLFFPVVLVMCFIDSYMSALGGRREGSSMMSSILTFVFSVMAF
jgi:hypothetical protein